MNGFLCDLSICLFLLLPPSLLAYKFLKNRPAWWLIIVLVIVLGWLFWFSTYIFYQLNIADLIDAGKELPDGWDSDGAAGLFAVFGGWLVALAYFVPWLAIYWLAVMIRAVISRGSSDNGLAT